MQSWISCVYGKLSLFNEVLKYTIHRESILLYILIWTSVFLGGGGTDTPPLHIWWYLSWVTKPGWIPCLLACFVSYMQWIPQITSGATPAGLFIASMAVKLFWSMYLHTCIQALVGTRIRDWVSYINIKTQWVDKKSK